VAPVLTPSEPTSRSPHHAMMLAQGKSGEFAVPYTMSERDVLLGFVSGAPPRRLERLPPSGPTPRAILEQILAEELSRQTCFVSFSGGRDSSALLAVALDVARRQGLPEPVALTLRYTENTDTEESEWQKLVVDHLRLKAWEVVEVAPGAAEFLGPTGVASLRANGLLWPPALHLETGWMGLASGATVITGEGGDEILGTHRASSVRAFLVALRPPQNDLLPAVRRLARDAAPAGVRAASARRKMAATGFLNWLRPPLRDQVSADVAQLITAGHWSWADAVRTHALTPGLLLGLANRDWLAASFGARFAHPLLRPAFVDAVARQGGRLGYAGRTDAMRRTFADVLPEAVLARQTKATFNTAFHGQATRSFAQSWDGTGVDPDLVDVDVLRSCWLAPRVHPATTPLLQAAWLAGEG
jgi:asparagine synthetase B (glutamine-hydrolysing)